MSADAAAAWRANICGLCTDCMRELRLLEGPICDACLDRRDLAQGRDKYAVFRNEEDRWHRMTEDSEDADVSGEHETERAAEAPPVRRPLRVRFELDLQTGAVVFCRPPDAVLGPSKTPTRRDLRAVRAA